MTTSSTNSIHNVIFDFGTVLISNEDYRTCLDGHCPPETLEAICSSPDSYGFWSYEDRLDGGALLEEVMDDYRREYGNEMAQAFRHYIEHYDETMKSMTEGMEQLVLDVKAAGCKVWGLTNWSSETYHYVGEKFPQIERMLDGIVVSGFEHMRKPDPAFFDLALDRWGIKADETAFIDDMPNNVAAANALGIHAHLFNGEPQARAFLSEQGVMV
ncbi:HAD family hydrolase [Bifidobacterium bombi]|uniref:HAD-superfamily hydrolase, subfamily IA, variant 3 n=1 Tax=Bifidobacterium bombi DSM 19703 TaxID=1341695 RepID=A0A080N2C6_9BIFI|nr:HAD family phosphatase [Bifidobacterium bombi]KFF30941.1 HAD-superfamily hydrolase, subfamily IA, variant 3 [Bifidobacterium bombi DSM 19703]